MLTFHASALEEHSLLEPKLFDSLDRGEINLARDCTTLEHRLWHTGLVLFVGFRSKLCAKFY